MSRHVHGVMSRGPPQPLRQGGRTYGQAATESVIVKVQAYVAAQLADCARGQNTLHSHKFMIVGYFTHEAARYSHPAWLEARNKAPACLPC
jgi:hypothetical protein